ncbi:MAG TPA: endonuclease III, partial [Planctomycetaceae bacterium]
MGGLKSASGAVDRKPRARKIARALAKAYPDAVCALHHEDPFQLLVATILSAQCTDQRVNMVTPELFRKYPTPEKLARSSQSDVEKIIQSTGFFRAKAKSLRGMAAALIERHGGRVPQTMDELTELPGVGRKTANVVLGNAFDTNVGVTVDTHVTRLCNRLGLTDHASDAVKIEQDLIAIVPQKDWALWSHLLIHHGRAICTARNPKCEQCPLLPHCPAGKTFIKE